MKVRDDLGVIGRRAGSAMWTLAIIGDFKRMSAVDWVRLFPIFSTTLVYGQLAK